MARDPQDEQTRVRQAAVGAEDTRLRGAAAFPGEGTLLRGAADRGGDTLVRGSPMGDDTLVGTLTGAQTSVARQASPFGPGYRLRGRYELDELIGQGAMGQVWRAKD